MKTSVWTLALLLFAGSGFAADEKQIVVVAANAPSAKLSGLAQRYDAEIRELLRRTPVTSISAPGPANEFSSNSRELALAIQKHSAFIHAKWMQCMTSLSSSGLNDAGVDNVFLRQFTQENALQNIQGLTAARTVKNSLVGSNLSGAQRASRALDILFNDYASICELDRSPQTTNSAFFMRDMNGRMERFLVSFIAFCEELKSFADRTNDKHL